MDSNVCRNFAAKGVDSWVFAVLGRDQLLRCLKMEISLGKFFVSLGAKWENKNYYINTGSLLNGRDRPKIE